MVTFGQISIFGLQVSAASGKEKDSKLTITEGGISAVTNVADADFTRTDNGLVLGYKFGPMFRMWFSSLATHMTTKDSDGTQTKYKGITGLLGFGWNVASHVSINLELGGSKYSEEDGKSYPITESAGGMTMIANAPTEVLFLFGISFPFGLY